MDIDQILARELGAIFSNQPRPTDDAAEALRLYFEAASIAMLTVNASEGDEAEAEGDRLYEELTEATDSILQLPGTSIAALRAKTVMAYFWARNGSGFDIAAVRGFEQLAEVFCGEYKRCVDDHFEQLKSPQPAAAAKASINAQIAL